MMADQSGLCCFLLLYLHYLFLYPAKGGVVEGVWAVLILADLAVDSVVEYLAAVDSVDSVVECLVAVDLVEVGDVS